ncbi:MAG: hypothetical protein PHV59_05295 [Victivallales bacterium]|nr:hypothetical protein [Victivallales bacterium]
MQPKPNFVFRLATAAVLMLAGIGVRAAGHKVTDSGNAAVLENGKILLRVEKGSKGKVLLKSADKTVSGADIDIVPSTAAGKALTAIKSYTVKKGGDSTAVKVIYDLSGGKTAEITYTLKNALEYLEIGDIRPPCRITLKMQSKALVIPDHIGESIVCYPTAGAAEYFIPADAAYAVNMLGDDNAVMALIWSSEQAVVTETGKGSCFDTLTVIPGKNGKLWTGLITSRGIWHKVTEKLNNMKFTEVKWYPPFTARWGVAIRKDKGITPQENGQYDVWYIPERKGDNKRPRIQGGVDLMKPATWQAWISGVGTFIYPGYFSKGQTFLLFPKFSHNQHVCYDGTFTPLIYPLDNENTPKDITLPLSAVKWLLGGKAYMKLLSLNSPENKYPATCGTTAKVEKIFYRDQEKAELDKIKDMLGKMDKFVLTVRNRLEEYIAWRAKMKKYFAARRRQSPNLGKLVADFNQDLDLLKELFDKQLPRMKTPQYCNSLSEQIIKLVASGKSSEQKEDECKKLGRQIRDIGGSQDSTLGKIRQLVKAVRQKASLKLATSRNPVEKKFLQTIRSETGSIMNNRIHMEGK